jgi:TctA family transporter
MSEEKKGMSETQKLMIAVVGVFAAGFIMVGVNKDQTNEEKEAAAQIRSLVAMQEMANLKCPKLIEGKTGTQVFFPTRTDTDKSTYVTMEWENIEDANFKKATCTLALSLGGVSKLVIDDKVLIDKKI